MKRIFLIVLLSFIVSSFCFAQSSITPEMAKDFMPVSQLSRGMKGYGLTVFQGTKIEKFNFEIKGILKDANNGGDLILVQLSSPLINSRNTGVIQGMSGSPCYINGKLIGAVAYGNSFSKENTCMLTPIYDMMETLDSKLNVNKSKDSEKSASINLKDRLFSGNTSNNSSLTQNMQRLLIPLSASGVSQKTLKMFGDSFMSMGFNPVAGGSFTASKTGTQGATLNPGAAVGVVMVSGDIVLSGTGTVTYRNGDKLLAFGHPMDGIGQTDVPMCTSYIVDVFSGYITSYKYSNPINIVGRVFQDRPFAIAGDVKEVASMTPVNVKVSDLSTGRSKEINCKVASYPYYFNNFAPLPVLEACFRIRPQIGQTNAKVTYEVEFLNGEKHKFTNHYTSESEVSMQILMQLFELLEKLNGSKYGFQKIKSMNVDITFDNGNRYAYIERVFIDKNVFKAGETVDVGLVMRPYASKDTFTEYKKIKIPENMEDGNVMVMIYGGTLANMVKLMPTMRQGGNVINLFEEQDSSTSFEQYFNKYLEFEKNNELIIKLVPPSGDVLVIDGNKLTNMPPYMNMLFTNTNNSLITSEKLEFKNIFPDKQYIPMGIATISLPIKNDINISVRGGNAKPLSANGFYIKKDFESLIPDIITGKIYLAGELEEALSVLEKEAKEKNVPSVLDEKKASGSSEESKTENKEPSKEDTSSQKTVKTISKRPLTLELKEVEELKKGTFINCNIGKDDMILPTIEIGTGVKVPEQMTTAAIKTINGDLIIGTGISCGIYVLKDNKSEKIIDLEGGLWVSSIIETKSGKLYASTSPNGTIYEIDLYEKSAKKVKEFSGKYISDMIVTKDENILVGFADLNEIFVLGENLEEITTLVHDGVYTTDFDMNEAGKIVAGTKKQTLEIENNNIKVLANDMGGSVNAVCVAENGDTYAYVANKNIVVKINSVGINKVAEKTGDMFRGICDKSGNVYFVGKNNILRIYPDDSYVIDDCKNYTVQFSNILEIEDGNALVCSVNPGLIYNINLHPKESIYGTNLIDFGTEVKITSLDTYMYDCNVRIGNTYDGSMPINSDEKVKSTKFFIRFNESSGGNLVPIKINYFMPNRAPVVKITNLNSNIFLTGKKSIEWEINDPDKDSFNVKLLCKKINSNEEYIQIYPSKDKKVERDAKQETSFEWDTKGVSDGIYEIKLVVDDVVSNPVDFKIGEFSVNMVTVSNALPHIEIEEEASIVAEVDKPVIITGITISNLINIAGVQYSLDEGEWMSASSLSNEFVGNNSGFKIELKPFASVGDHSLLIRAIDEAGNYSDKTIKFTVK